MWPLPSVSRIYGHYCLNTDRIVGEGAEGGGGGGREGKKGMNREKMEGGREGGGGEGLLFLDCYFTWQGCTGDLGEDISLKPHHAS